MERIFEIALRPALDAETEFGFTEGSRWAWILRESGIDYVENWEKMV